MLIRAGRGLPLTSRAHSSSCGAEPSPPTHSAAHPALSSQEWLSRFGYLPPADPTTGQLQTQEELSKAIAAMQRFGGLETTGILGQPSRGAGDGRSGNLVSPNFPAPLRGPSVGVWLGTGPRCLWGQDQGFLPPGTLSARPAPGCGHSDGRVCVRCTQTHLPHYAVYT